MPVGLGGMVRKADAWVSSILGLLRPPRAAPEDRRPGRNGLPGQTSRSSSFVWRSDAEG